MNLLRRASRLAKTLAGPADGAGDLTESLVGAGAQSGDRHEADHDDQGQHDGVFNGRRAVFRLQELYKHLTELAHRTTPSFRNSSRNTETTRSFRRPIPHIGHLHPSRMLRC